MKHRTFIIGNGFDMDLGLHTSFQDFVSSDLWPITDSDIERSSLAKKLEKDKKENWFNLEDALCEYAQARPAQSELNVMKIGTYSFDMDVYRRIKEALLAFIRNHQRIQPNKDSMAADVLRHISSYGVFDNILSFNYTDIDSICEKVGSNKVNYKHVHGACSDGKIILGVADGYELKEGYDVLYKTSDTNYKSANVQNSLHDVDEVVFYGHSLGSQDYHYFDYFFKHNSREGMTTDDLVNITFFTKNEDSAAELKRQLRKMIPEGFGRLMDSNHVTFIHTQDKSSSDLADFYNRLSAIQKQIIRQRVRGVTVQ